MRFLSVRPDFCRRLPSDSTSRWTPLPLAICFPSLGRIRDFHPLEHAHAGRTTKKKLRDNRLEASCKSVAATYSPTWWGSTIGDGELNFSVRNGKRWILTAITATIFVLRKNNSISNSIQVPSLSRSCFLWLSLCLFNISPPSQGPSRLSNKLHRGRCRAISTARL